MRRVMRLRRWMACRVRPSVQVSRWLMPGETVTIYATGLGLTTPAFAAGQLPPTGSQVSNATVSIDGAPLDSSAIQYVGVAPLNAGLYQLNIVLPASITSGDHTIAMSVSGVSSPVGSIGMR